MNSGRLYPYRVGVGIEGYVLERHIVWAKNQQEARSKTISKYLHPDKGYNHVEVQRITKADAEKYSV